MAVNYNAENNYSSEEGGKNGKYNWTSFLLCFFFGWLGLHRFYQKKYITGVLYLFSFGLIGIGWIVDTWSLLINRVSFLRVTIQVFSKNTTYDDCCNLCTNYPFECTLCGHKRG